MKILIINGPNLNLLGIREPQVYGNRKFEDFLQNLRILFPDVEIDYYQSNVEGEIINKLHEAGFLSDGIILNPGGYSHTSVAIADAVKAVPARVVEVHLSNVFSREEFRRNLVTATAADGFICGMGLDVYRLGVLSLTELLK